MAKVKCKYCLEKVEKSEAVFTESNAKKPVKSYYHKECMIQQKAKKEALDLFYEYTGSLVMQSQVYLVFKKCREKGLTDTDILYTMNYIVKNNHVLNFPFGILHYLDRAMKDKKEADKVNERHNRVINSPIKIMPLAMKRKEKERDDKYDISDLL